MLLYDLKRAVSWRWILISVAVLTVLTLAVRMDAIAEVLRQNQLLAPGWCAGFLWEAWSGQAMTFCVPVLCALPAASSFIDEYQTGMCRLALGRTTRAGYLRSKAGTAALSGGLVIAAGLLASAGIMWLLFRFMVSRELAAESEVTLTMLLAAVARYAVFGALGAVTGLTVSTAVRNRYMAWLSPFMGEYLLIILCERYWEKALLLSPAEWLRGGENWPLEGWSCVLWMGLLCFLLMVVFCRLGGKFLREL